MTRRQWFGVVLGVAVLLGMLWLGQGGAGLGSSSSLSSSSQGWAAARHYVEARGVEVTIGDQPLNAIPTTGTWVLTFPWRGALEDGDLDAVSRHLQAGGHLLLAYSGDGGHTSEELVLRELNLEGVRLLDDPPLIPWEWREFRRRMWSLESPESGDSILELPPLSWVPEAPYEAEVLYAGGDEDWPLVFTVGRGRGRVTVLPHALLANGGLRAADNIEVLEGLLAELPSPWRFDEYHHGWRNQDEASFTSATQAWDMFVLHLLVIYGLAVLALIRRFGPAWRQPVDTTGSASDFLRGVGSLHDRLGHHAEAARWMVQRAKDLNPRVDWETVDTNVRNGRELVALGQEVSRRQRRRRS